MTDHYYKVTIKHKIKVKWTDKIGNSRSNEYILYVPSFEGLLDQAGNLHIKTNKKWPEYDKIERQNVEEKLSHLPSSGQVFDSEQRDMEIPEPFWPIYVDYIKYAYYHLHEFSFHRINGMSFSIDYKIEKQTKIGIKDRLKNFKRKLLHNK